jgi:hypothetical protein
MTAPIPWGEGPRETWTGELAKAREARKTVAAWWDENIKAYVPDQAKDPKGYGAEINTNRDFTLVERKKADLFYQRPDVTAIPSPLLTDQEPLLYTHTQILNEKLGPDGVDAKRLVHEALFDVLCPSGTGWTVMGYESVTQDVETMDPMTGQPTSVPVPVHEDCFWRHVPPKRGLIPASFRSTRWDDAPWLGVEFDLPVRVAKRKGWVPEDYQGAPLDPELGFTSGPQPQGTDAVAHGVLIYYKSSVYRDDRVHPQHYTRLVLMDGVEEPAEHVDSPYQTLDPQGRLTADSLLGNPIHPLTIRTLTDSAYVPSDCAISRPIVNELNVFRKQMIDQRDANTMRWQYNADTLPREALDKIVRSPIGGFIGVPAEAFVGEGAIKELPHGSYPRENFSFNDYLDNDLARTHALDSEQAGAQAEGEQTATEANIRQSNINARLGFERGVVMDWYLRGVTKYSSLVQRYLPVERAAGIVGVQQAQVWDSWRKVVPASLAFTALPDAALRTDLAWERKRKLDEYTFFANDPFINRIELLKKLTAYLGYPPAVVNLQPPQKGPEPTKPGFSFKGEDLNPLMPQFQIVLEILKQAGITITPEAIAAAQGAAQNQVLMGQMAQAQAQTGEGGADTQHGGKVAQMEGLSKHQTDQTGGMQGTGAPIQ